MTKNALYAQSGGVTAVINASAYGVIDQAKKYPDKIGKVFAAKNGIIGALNEELYDTSLETDAAIQGLRYTPAGAFGSCRHKLKSPQTNREEYERLLEVFLAHDIGYFFYNGGGDSQDTAHKVAQFCAAHNHPVQCVGIPKTVDNDLPFTDNCPGFGSVAKYVATSIKEAALDVASMAATSTKVFVMEVMGRHAGWIAASSALASADNQGPPHIILLPEVTFDPDKFIAQVDKVYQQHGFVVVAVSEGIRTADGKFLSETGAKDAFGHAQLGGVGPRIAEMIKSRCGLKYHWAVADYLQRAARHIAAKPDVEQAEALGRAAIDKVVAGASGMMLTVERIQANPYQWKIGEVPLEKVANVERKMPAEFIRDDGFHITDLCREYLQPLIIGEDYPPYKDGVPAYVQLKNQCVSKKLPQMCA